MTNPMDYRGMVEGPGKFEGEPRATVYYYDLIMNGDGEDVGPELPEGESLTMFTVSEDEEKAFGQDADLLHGDLVVLHENTQGFVTMFTYGSAPTEQVEADLEYHFCPME